ncbi:zinc finger protein 432-like [Penaeus monodon]|uniref:zinc finger protein 432-like n=1 Tax=Penaeus monodon TaxID=6687 RepID=UPI0018A72506|nr:zinc finger protein 432-like [Penaeus monodon]
MSFLTEWMPFASNVGEESYNPENYIKEERREDSEESYLEIKEESFDCKSEGTDVDIKHECSFYENPEGEGNEIGAYNLMYANNYSLSALPFLAETDGVQSTHEDYDNEVMHEILDMNGKHCVCEVCSRKFACKNHLLNHNKMHINVNPCICDLCSNAVLSNNDLALHMRISAKEKFHGKSHDKRLYTCDLCSKGKQSKESHESAYKGEAL